MVAQQQEQQLRVMVQQQLRLMTHQQEQEHDPRRIASPNLALLSSAAATNATNAAAAKKYPSMSERGSVEIETGFSSPQHQHQIVAGITEHVSPPSPVTMTVSLVSSKFC
jgi:hypothetical protein